VRTKLIGMKQCSWNWTRISRTARSKLVDRPADGRILPLVWVYRVKTTGDGDLDKYKARLCIQGCKQRAGIDFHLTFAPVIRYSGVRMLLAIAVHRGLLAHHLDVRAAYLHSPLEEEIYTFQPQGFGDNLSEQ